MRHLYACALLTSLICLGSVAPTFAQPTGVDFDAVSSSTVTSTPPGSDALTIQAIPQYNWSNGKQLFWQATAADQTLDLTFSSPAAGSYLVRLNLTKSYDYGILGFALNGTALPGTEFDGYSSAVLPQQWAELGIRPLTAGNNTLRLTVKGKNPAQNYASKFYAGIDFIELTACAQPTGVDFDAVSSSTVTSTPPGSEALTIQAIPQYNWSNDKQLFWQATAADQTLDLTFSSPAAGSYLVRLNLTKSYDYGILGFALNGTALPGTEFDGYSSTVLPQQWAELGTQQLTSGDNTLRLTVKGKNPAQNNPSKFYAGIDYVELTACTSPVLLKS